MATDVDVQYFSHLNGLVLSNNWGDMIRLLDTCLVNGLPLTSITSASIDAQGDITLNLYAAHNCMLFQIIELTGFAPSELNGKYRIKGTPTSTQLILKATHTGKTITTAGTAKLASLGYDIIFRDTNDVKRVYRAKNPTEQHPFIRVDETISDGTNSYTSTYAKSAMVGLIENMAHIDDYADTNKLQLPLDTADFTKNWKIAGTGGSVVRGWSKWFWARSATAYNAAMENQAPAAGGRNFTLVGSGDAFYLLVNWTASDDNKVLYGAGTFNTNNKTSTIRPWFLMSSLLSGQASVANDYTVTNGGLPLCGSALASKFFTPKADELSPLSNSAFASPILPDYKTGNSNIFAGTECAALEVPFSDSDDKLRGGLKHVFYAGNKNSLLKTTTYLQGTSIYIWDCALVTTSGAAVTGGLYFYLGELT